jgi:hypothetical protein
MIMMAMTPEQEAACALYFEVSRSDLRPEVQAAYDRLAEERQQARQERERLVAATTWFPDLGIGVRDGNVYEHTAAMKLLGPLAGAHAEALAGNAGKRRSAGERAAAVAVVGPVEAVSRAYKGVAVVAFADGSTSEKMLTDLASVARAQAAAAQLNSLAAAVPLGGSSPGPLAARDLPVPSPFHQNLTSSHVLQPRPERADPQIP